MRSAWPVAAFLTILTAASAADAAPLVSQADSNVLCAAWKDLGYEPTQTRVEISGAIASYESGFGRGWRSSGLFSKNWGAIHAAVPTCADGTRSHRCAAGGRASCPPGTFLHRDSDTRGPYQACFRAYPTARDAAIDFVKVLVRRTPCRTVEGALPVLAAIDTGDTTQVAEALWATCYFTTHVGAEDPLDRVFAYAAALDRHRAPRVCADWLLTPKASGGTPVASWVEPGNKLIVASMGEPDWECMPADGFGALAWWR